MISMNELFIPLERSYYSLLSKLLLYFSMGWCIWNCVSMLSLFLRFYWRSNDHSFFYIPSIIIYVFYPFLKKSKHISSSILSFETTVSFLWMNSGCCILNLFIQVLLGFWFELALFISIFIIITFWRS